MRYLPGTYIISTNFFRVVHHTSLFTDVDRLCTLANEAYQIDKKGLYEKKGAARCLHYYQA